MFHFSLNIKIISGGQTGVDRAALDFAINNNIPCGGWCPKGRLAEDGKILQKYPLIETLTTDYKERTEKNIKNSQATIIIHTGKIDIGTKLTIKLCKVYNKPVQIINMKDKHLKKEIFNWIEENNIDVLNIAGPRESNSPGIYNETIYILNRLFKTSERSKF